MDCEAVQFLKTEYFKGAFQLLKRTLVLCNMLL